MRKKVSKKVKAPTIRAKCKSNVEGASMEAGKRIRASAKVAKEAREVRADKKRALVSAFVSPTVVLCVYRRLEKLCWGREGA